VANIVADIADVITKSKRIVLQWLTSYLSHRQQFIRVGNRKSTSAAACGVHMPAARRRLPSDDTHTRSVQTINTDFP